MGGKTVRPEAGGRRRTEMALEESEERFRTAFENAPVGMAIVGLDFEIRQVNPALCRLLGYSRDELLAKTFLELTHPDDIEKDLELAQRLVHGEVENYQLEKRYITKDGHIIWGRLSVTLVRDPEGTASYALAILKDFSEYKQIVKMLSETPESADKQGAKFSSTPVVRTERAAIDQTEKSAQPQDRLLQDMVCSLSVPVVVLDHEGVIVYASKSQDSLPLDHQSQLQCVALGVNYLEVCRQASAEGDLYAREALSGIQAVMAKKAQSFTLEYPCHSPRARYWFLMQVDPMPREHGGVAISHINITDRKRAEEELHDLLLKVQSLKDRLQAENAYLQKEVRLAHDFDQIVGRSEALKHIFRQAQQAAATDSTILVLGETGTGKELLAHAIHSASLRRHRPLFIVNCAALPATLIESELFGYEKGAFTGAGTSRVGRFELASGATIFLDEIGELPPELQAKLLRVLQDGEFERLGSSRTIKVDVRVIAATNQDLEEAVRLGKFRADLFYRLNVFPVRIPPLRERREDIPLLVRFFVEQISQRVGKRIENILPEELEALEKYHWPGNIRELKNVIERAVIITPDGRLRLIDSLRINQAMELGPESGGIDRDIRQEGKHSRLDEVEREHILQVLEQTYWRIEGEQGAALILGINPGTLRSRMKKLGIQRPKTRN
jgi:PAS domain S-box-containing protein